MFKATYLLNSVSYCFLFQGRHASFLNGRWWINRSKKKWQQRLYHSSTYYSMCIHQAIRHFSAVLSRTYHESRTHNPLWNNQSEHSVPFSSSFPVTHHYYLLCFLSRCPLFRQRNKLFSPFSQKDEATKSFWSRKKENLKRRKKRRFSSSLLPFRQ